SSPNRETPPGGSPKGFETWPTPPSWDATGQSHSYRSRGEFQSTAWAARSREDRPGACLTTGSPYRAWAGAAGHPGRFSRAYRPSWARPERRQTPPGRAPSWADRAFDRTAPCGRETSRDYCSAEYPRGSPPSPGKSLETHPYRSPLRQSFRILPGEERLESLFRGGLLCLLLALPGAGSDD